MEAAERAETAWGVDSEYGRLLDVLLCPPDHFRWLPTSAISRATVDSGLVFSLEDAKRQHAEMVSVYEEAGVRVHFLEPDPVLPYQVFARDSSINVPDGPIVTQCAQWWRRGEYAAVIRFYEGAGIPIRDMVTAGSFEGGDFMIVEPGVAAIGTGEERTQEQAARQVASRLEAEGWEVRVERIPPHFLHIDVLACMLGEKLAAVCVEQASNGFVSWLESKGVEIVPVTLAAALKLGVNGVALGGDRVLSTAESRDLNERLRALGLTVLRPGAERVHPRGRRGALPDAGDPPRTRGLMPADPRRVIADLRELDRRTGGPDGARRVCWTDEWRAARHFLRERLAELDAAVEEDEAGNLWARLAGRRAETVALGSHLDSVPGGGWLDGALGVMAALEVLRAVAEARRRALGGAGGLRRRGGRPLRPQPVRQLGGGRHPGAGSRGGPPRRRADARSRAVLAEHGVELDDAPRAARMRDGPGGLPRAAHRAGPGAGARGRAGGGGDGHERRGALPPALRRAGRPRRYDADGHAS